MNSVNGGREGDKGGSKKREKRDKEVGGQKIGPYINDSAELLSQLSQTELTQSTPKKKSFSFSFLFISFPTPKKKITS